MNVLLQSYYEVTGFRNSNAISALFRVLYYVGSSALTVTEQTTEKLRRYREFEFASLEVKKSENVAYRARHSAKP